MENNSTAKVITILDYIGFLWILGLFVEKNNEDVKFHTNQGLILFIYNVIAGVLNAALSWIPLVGWIFGVCCWILTVLGKFVWAAFCPPRRFPWVVCGSIRCRRGRRPPCWLLRWKRASTFSTTPISMAAENRSGCLPGR